MTTIIEHEGWALRLACQDCGCELGAKRDGEPWRYVRPADESTWTGVVDVGEPPVHLDLTDGCPCHDTYLRLMTHAYAEGTDG